MHFNHKEYSFICGRKNPYFQFCTNCNLFLLFKYIPISMQPNHNKMYERVSFLLSCYFKRIVFYIVWSVGILLLFVIIFLKSVRFISKVTEKIWNKWLMNHRKGFYGSILHYLWLKIRDTRNICKKLFEKQSEKLA